MKSTDTKSIRLSFKPLVLGIVALLSSSYASFGQAASSYGFSSSAATYSPISGGTVLSSGTSMDDARYSVSIPAFTYLGTVYTQAYANENGYIQFGTTSPSIISSYISSTSSAATSGVAAYNRDLKGKSATSELRVQTVGVETIFQWNNLTNYGSTGQSYTFQIRLNATTGAINVVYGTMSSTSSTTAQVGLRGSSSDFNNRTSTSNWAASSAGLTNGVTMTLSTIVFPSSGQTYTWLPPAPCSSKPAGGSIVSAAAGATTCPSSLVTLNVTGATVATGLSYQWDSSLISATGPWYAITGATNKTYDAIPATCNTTHYRRRTICGAVGLFDSSTVASLNVSCALTVPYYEDFESITNAGDFPNCMSASSTIASTYLSATSYNRSNHTSGGSKYAAFRYAANDYIYTPGIITTAGTTYEFSFWYITDGLSGWDSLIVLTGTSPSPSGMTSALGIPILKATNTSYQKQSVRFVATSSGVQYFAIHCVSTFSPWYLSIDDIRLQQVPPCTGTPVPGRAVASSARVCGLGTVDLDLPDLAAALGYTFEWQDSTSGSTWSSGAGHPSFGGSTSPFTTLEFATTTYFRCMVKCSLTGDSAFSSTVKVIGGPIEPPYFEDFESITANDQLPQCMSATNLGSIVRTYLVSGSYNRQNHTPGGNNFGSFRYGADDYIFSPEMKLIGGQQYILSFWYITDGLSGWNSLTAKFGTAADPISMTSSLKTISSPNNTVYSQYVDTFTVPTSGLYYFGIYANSTFAPWYLSIDDIGLQLRPCDGMPTSASIVSAKPSGSGVCANSLVNLKGIGGPLSAIPGIEYQWQRKALVPGGVWKNMLGANDTLLSADTLAGYDYRLVVICSNTNDSAFSAPYSLPLLPAHPPISISPATTPIVFCVGDTVKFNATNVAGSVYDWMLDSTVIPGWKFSDLAAVAPGTYFVKASSVGTPCPAYSNAVVLVQNDPGYAVSIAKPTDSIICTGASVALVSSGSKSGLTYQWYKDNVVIPGATSNAYLANTGGIYRVTAHDGISTCMASSRSIQIVVNPGPDATLFAPSGNTTACEMDGVLLKTNPSAFSYEWYRSGSIVVGWNDSAQLIKTSGTYTVKVRDANGCVSISKPINVSILPAPIPMIVKSGFTLSTSIGSYVSYRWIRNGSELVGTSSSITVSKNGIYKVIVTDPNGCEGTSTIINIFDPSLSIDNLTTTAQILIYPNPTNAKLYIESPIPVNAEVRDVTGKLIIRKQLVNQLDLSNVSDGLYLISISDQEDHVLLQQKISKQTK